MEAKWFIDRRKRVSKTIENSLRDLHEVEEAPRKSIEDVLDFLFKIGFLREEE